MALNDKQKLFVAFYVETANATESAIKAGYSKRTARMQGSRNLNNPEISKAIQMQFKRMTSDSIATAEEILIFHSKVMRGEIKDSFGLEASLDTRIKSAIELGKRFGVNKPLKETDQINKLNELKIKKLSKELETEDNQEIRIKIVGVGNEEDDC